METISNHKRVERVQRLEAIRPMRNDLWRRNPLAEVKGEAGGDEEKAAAGQRVAQQICERPKTVEQLLTPLGAAFRREIFNNG